MLELLAIAAALRPATAAPQVVVTFDNGEFNAPFFTPRWNGKWEKPSAAQEIAASVARVSGANPLVFTYLPPGQGKLGPGGAWPVPARRAGCEGAAGGPADPCFCGAGDNCWEGIRPNWYAAASTSLWLTTSNLRERLGPSSRRIEVHFTDLFEEDPAAAAKPADSDRCVTADGVERALSALVAPTADAALDHLAVGLLKATIDPPPPGGSWGDVYRLGPEPGEAGCHGGVADGDWSSGHGPWTANLAVVVLGYGTATEHEAVSAFLDGLVGQLDTGAFQFELARLREPPAHATVSRSATLSDTAPLTLQAVGRLPTLPCAGVGSVVSLTADGLPFPVDAVEARCDGSVALPLDRRSLIRAYLREAGLDPRRRTLRLTGTVTLTESTDALQQRFSVLSALADTARPLPLWSAVGAALLPPGGGGAARPWETQVDVQEILITDLDQRPWLLSTVVASILGGVVGMGVASVVRRLHADRALRRHWQASLAGGRDPLYQPPVASVIGGAQEEVARSWPLRVLAGTGVGIACAGLIAFAILLAYRVLLG